MAETYMHLFLPFLDIRIDWIKINLQDNGNFTGSNLPSHPDTLDTQQKKKNLHIKHYTSHSKCIDLCGYI